MIWIPIRWIPWLLLMGITGAAIEDLAGWKGDGPYVVGMFVGGACWLGWHVAKQIRDSRRAALNAELYSLLGLDLRR